MKSHFQFIEPLEARVAPAVLVNGGNLLGGSGNPTTGETSTGGNTVTLVNVLQRTGPRILSIPPATILPASRWASTRKLDITGNVFGDIVTNLLPNGHLTDSDRQSRPTARTAASCWASISRGSRPIKLGTENGDINRIISGGDAKNINVSGQLKGLYAGDGVFRDGSTIAVVSTGPVDYNSVAWPARRINSCSHSRSKRTSYISANINKVVVQTAEPTGNFRGRWPPGFDNGSGPSGRQHYQRDDHARR